MKRRIVFPASAAFLWILSLHALTGAATEKSLTQQSEADLDPQAMQILHQVASAYRDVKGYEFLVTARSTRGSKITEQHFHESGSGSGKFRTEEGGSEGQVEIADSQTVWTLDPGKKEYTKAPERPETSNPITDFQQIDQHVTRAVFYREDLYTINGTNFRVAVVRVWRDQWPASAARGVVRMGYAIDEQTLRVRAVTTFFSNDDDYDDASYTVEKWNEPMPDAQFMFSPPEGVREVSHLSEPKPLTVKLMGSAAPEFALPDMNGRTVSLAALRGKVVILDFWASWCGPCQVWTPFLQQVETKFADQGLVVLGLNVGEDPITIEQYEKSESSTFPVLVGAEPDITDKYYVGAFPTTYVIDRKGQVVYREDGVDTEIARELITVVEKALTEK
jgi:thiol-disulfide isomerase/thioredoxin